MPDLHGMSQLILISDHTCRLSSLAFLSANAHALYYLLNCIMFFVQMVATTLETMLKSKEICSYTQVVETVIQD